MRKTAVMMLMSLALLTLGLFLLSNPLPPATAVPQASKGLIDLSRWSFAEDGVVSLDGEWEFYGSQLLTPAAFTGTDSGTHSVAAYDYVKVPGDWSRYRSKGGSSSPFGFATYRLRIKLPDEAVTYGVRVTNVKTAHTLYMNGKQLGSRGVPGKSTQETTAVNAPYVRFFQADGGMAELIVQVANYQYARGGIDASIQLGSQSDILVKRETAYTKDLVAAVTCLLMGTYFIVLFAMRRTERTWFYFGLMCLGMAIYTATHGEKILWLPWLSYEWYTKLQDLSGVASELFLLMYTQHALPHLFKRRAMQLLGFFIAVRMLLILATPASVFTSFSLIGFGFTFISVLYIIYVMTAGAVRKLEGAFYMLVSALMLQSMVIVSLLMFLGHQVPFGYQLITWLSFFAAQVLLLSQRFVKAFVSIEKLSERLRAMNRMKDEFLANTSHEMKTPLHAIVNIAQSLLEGAAGKLTSQQEDNMVMVVNTGKRMTRLVGDLLDSSKLKNGELILNRRAVALQPIVQVIFDTFKHVAEGKPVKWIDETSGSHFAFADEDRLSQILNNIIGNAIKFTAAGEITVSAQEAGGWLAISVEDTGIGIPSDKIGDIFESYEQASVGIAQAYGGTGLGLSIAKRLVELHGGTIWATSIFGKGTVITFTLPLAHRSPASGLEPAAAPAFGLNDLPLAGHGRHEHVDKATELAREPRATILVVDDDAANRRVLLNLLSIENYHVITTSSGMEAVEVLEHSSIDMAIVDLMMPGMSGYDLCRIIRARYSLTELPVLLLTARNRPEEMLAAFDTGVNDFLGKPVEAGELQARIRTLLRMKQSASELVSTEMAFLQAQIKPHFLFNALNTIAAYSLDDPKSARKLLASLSQYLRGSFDFRNLERLVPLRKELELLEAYVLIEQARFGERLKVIYEVEEGVDCLLPPLVIQPIVENAVQHGLGSRKKGGTVVIRIWMAEGDCLIEVADDGVGLQIIGESPGGRREPAGSGVALKNIRKRLKRIYGRDLEITGNASGGTTVTIRIPREEGTNGERNRD